MKQIAAALLVVLFLFPVLTMAADFDGDSRNDIAIFRPASGLWAVRGVTRAYFGQNGDEPRPGDYDGDGIADIAVFRENSGLWAVRGVTRAYFGSSGDTALQGGGGQRIYDYVVRWNDGTDLERALESDDYDSVFIPAGEYDITDPITVDHVTLIRGESTEKVNIVLGQFKYLAIASPGCTVEKLTVTNGGFTNIGAIYIGENNVTVRDCRSRYSKDNGFLYTTSADSVSLVNCTALYAEKAGFSGQSTVRNSSLVGCRVFDTGTVTTEDRGFYNCNNLSNCYVDGEYAGFDSCEGIAASVAYNCSSYGFRYCSYLSACRVLGGAGSRTLYGLDHCSNLSACHAENCDVNEYNGGDFYYYGVVPHKNSCD
jgi:hypothetical protein